MRAAAFLLAILALAATGCESATRGSEASSASIAARPVWFTAPLEFPEIRTVGDAPDDAAAITVVVGRNGQIAVEGAPAEIDDVRRALGDAVTAQGPENTPVVLAIDREVPWGAVARLVIECAIAGIDRLYFVADPADGSETGAIAVFLPSDAGQLPGDHPEITVFVREGWPPSDVLGLHDVLRERAASGALSVTLDAEATTPLDLVLHVADVAALEGAATFEFAAIGLPSLPAGGMVADVARLRTGEAARRLVVFEEELDGPSLLIPHADRVRGRSAGFWR